MIIHVGCPVCGKEIDLAAKEVSRGKAVTCPHCTAEIILAGRFLSEVFWAANNVARENSY